MNVVDNNMDETNKKAKPCWTPSVTEGSYEFSSVGLLILPLFHLYYIFSRLPIYLFLFWMKSVFNRHKDEAHFFRKILIMPTLV